MGCQFLVTFVASRLLALCTSTQIHILSYTCMQSCLKIGSGSYLYTSTKCETMVKWLKLCNFDFVLPSRCRTIEIFDRQRHSIDFFFHTHSPVPVLIPTQNPTDMEIHGSEYTFEKRRRNISKYIHKPTMHLFS